MDIKKLSMKDFEKIIEMWNSTKDIFSFDNIKYDKKVMNNIIKNKNEVILVAKLNKQIIGAIYAEILSEYCMVKKLIVDTIFRNKGVGTKLLKELEKYTRKKKCKKMHFLTNIEDEQFHSFLEKNKYNPKKLVMFTRKL